MKAFYGKKIDADAEQRLIRKILLKYRHEPVTEDLKDKIYTALSSEKSNGKISIPFKVVLRKDPTAFHRDYIEVMLDTKI